MRSHRRSRRWSAFRASCRRRVAASRCRRWWVARARRARTHAHARARARAHSRMHEACSGFTMPALVVRARAPRVHSRTRAHACVWREMDGGGAAGASRATAVSAVTPARALPGALCRHRRVPAQVSLSGPAPAAVFVAARERVPAGGEGGRAGVLPRPGPTLRDAGRAAQGDAVPSSVCPRARRALTPARAHGR